MQQAVRQSAGRLGSAGLLSSFALVSSAFAQSAVDPAPATTLDPVVVTASRIDRAGFTAPTPTTVVSTATLEQRAAVNVADVLNEVPSFRRTAAPESGGIGNTGANNVDLRGLTPIRTLVLLDRQFRYVATKSVWVMPLKRI